MNIDYEFNTVNGVHFRKEEISQIEKGFAHGLTEEQVKIYVNPYFSDLDMKLIRKGIDQLEQHKAGRQSEGSWNYPTLFDLTEREAIKEYNKMWNRVANWP